MCLLARRGTKGHAGGRDCAYVYETLGTIRHTVVPMYIILLYDVLQQMVLVNTPGCVMYGAVCCLVQALIFKATPGTPCHSVIESYVISIRFASSAMPCARSIISFSYSNGSGGASPRP